MLAALADLDPSVQVAIASGVTLVSVSLIGMFGSGRARSKRIEKSLDTTNGMPIGEAVYKLVGDVALVRAQGQTNANEILEMRAGLDEHQRQLESHIRQDRYNALALRTDLKEQQKIVKDALDKRHAVEDECDTQKP